MRSSNGKTNALVRSCHSDYQSHFERSHYFLSAIKQTDIFLHHYSELSTWAGMDLFGGQCLHLRVVVVYIWVNSTSTLILQEPLLLQQKLHCLKDEETTASASILSIKLISNLALMFAWTRIFSFACLLVLLLSVHVQCRMFCPSL